MANKPDPEYCADTPWMVTTVQAQLEEMAGGCNELYRANREMLYGQA